MLPFLNQSRLHAAPCSSSEYAAACNQAEGQAQQTCNDGCPNGGYRDAGTCHWYGENVLATECTTQYPNNCGCLESYVPGQCHCNACGPAGDYSTYDTCTQCGYAWNGDTQQCQASGSPILINLKNNSSNDHLTSAADGVMFDIYATGVPIRVAWTSPESEVAFVVLDRNGNGIIDDASELFGNHTRKRDGTVAANGFEALLDLDGGSGISDNRIDSSDAMFSRLRLWLDDNHNGFSEPNELLTLADADVIALFTSYRQTRRGDRHGNQYWYEGSALVLKNGSEQHRKLFDVVFATSH